ncbi:putative DNA_LIGASE_A3 domain-containing protein [Azospirillaceae bacterium]
MIHPDLLLSIRSGTACCNPVDYDAAKVSLPTMVQYKLDGVRGLFVPGDGFYSRDGNRWFDGKVAHIKPPPCKYVLDGEFYCHGMPFQEIAAAMAVMSYEVTPNQSRIKFHVFDFIAKGMSFRARQEQLGIMFTQSSAGTARIRATECNCVPAVMGQFNAAVASGYEGVVLRNPFNGYRAGKSQDAVRMKAWLEEPFEVVGVSPGKGKYAGMVGALICKTAGSKFFKADGFSDEARHDWMANPPIGRIVEIRFLQYSSVGIPMKPKFLKFAPI